MSLQMLIVSLRYGCTDGKPPPLVRIRLTLIVCSPLWRSGRSSSSCWRCPATRRPGPGPARRSNSGSSLLALTCPSHRKLAATHHKRRITAQSAGLSSDRRLEHTSPGTLHLLFGAPPSQVQLTRPDAAGHTSAVGCRFGAQSRRKGQRTASSGHCTRNSPPLPPSQRRLQRRWWWMLPLPESEEDKHEEKGLYNLLENQHVNESGPVGRRTLLGLPGCLALQLCALHHPLHRGHLRT
ncbi:uncharacterized protein LOC130165645 [Seriola aureovittata]|uniref:uncharacterized protein LOC130165645 n=1 Tax=Seriola aureovittata TaxID=2871759 RepID=UPI0024BE04E1|nr:uncharacterized protein LOC130165645 [Seriola aureovittata]